MVFTSVESFSGSIDDLKMFHKVSPIKQIKSRKFKTYYPPDHDIDDSLKLYLKFNEPSGSYSIENYVIDTSGNSLHSKIENFDRNSRNIYILDTAEKLPSPVENENFSRIYVYQR